MASRPHISLSEWVGERADVLTEFVLFYRDEKNSKRWYKEFTPADLVGLLEQYEIVLANCKELNESNFQHIAEKERLQEQLEAAERSLSNAHEAMDQLERSGADPANLEVIRYAIRAGSIPAGERDA